MTSSLAELVGALEQVWVDPLTADLGVVAAALEERQEILDRIQRADARALAAEARAVLFERLRAVLLRDDLMRRALEEQQRKVREALGNRAVSSVAPRPTEVDPRPTEVGAGGVR